MIRALWTAASGMLSQQLNVDVIANNLSNVNTAGFKKSRVEFQELMYETIRPPGREAAREAEIPSGVEVGHGVRAAATQRLHSQGNLQQTNNPLDLAIEGEGFFRLEMPDGTYTYTRDGGFKLSSERELVNSQGYKLSVEGGGQIPDNALEIGIAPDGTITALVPGVQAPKEVGRVVLVRFVNPAGLESLGQNLYRETVSSGEAITGKGTESGVGRVMQGYLEMSNVQVVEEMVNLIVAQRAYEINSKAIQTSDEMLALANNLRR